MNKELLEKIADHLERKEPVDGVGFNMSSIFSHDDPDKFNKECGTTCCIAGWAIILEHG